MSSMDWEVGRSLDSKGRKLRLLGELTGRFLTLNKRRFRLDDNPRPTLSSLANPLRGSEPEAFSKRSASGLPTATTRAGTVKVVGS